jgi:hypothetical protein
VAVVVGKPVANVRPAAVEPEVSVGGRCGRTPRQPMENAATDGKASWIDRESPTEKRFAHSRLVSFQAASVVDRAIDTCVP